MAQSARPTRAEGTPERDRRRGKADFFGAGMRLLADGGIKAVTIANVCARLHVTKGSFYHHFESGPAFHAELLANYEDEYSRRRIEAVDAIADPHLRLDALVDRGVDRDHEAESALRAWGRTDTVAAAVMQRVDARRTRYLVDFFVRQGLPKSEAQVHAEISIGLIAGAQAMDRIVDRRRLRGMLAEQARWLAMAFDRAQARHPARATNPRAVAAARRR